MDFKVYIQKNIQRRTKGIMDDLGYFSLVYLMYSKPLPDFLRLRSSYYYNLAEELIQPTSGLSARDSRDWQIVADELDNAYWLVWNEQRSLDLLPRIDQLINDIEEGLEKSLSSHTC